MARNFPDFIDAYLEYANDGFLPPQFNEWCALSIVAAALERKVWLPWSDTFSFFPNIYVLLVSIPGDGKSVALNKAVGLLQEVNAQTNQLNIMPNQVTEAKFIELMGHGSSFTDTHTGKELVHFQNAGYYWASEASNALKNIYGDFIACLTDFYDCPSTWARATKKDGKAIRLQNVCMNILAGTTFDYLGKLVNDENIMGGFASRLIYVVSKNKEINDQAFQAGVRDAAERDERRTYRAALVEDLLEISRMVGPMRAEAAFGNAWREWFPVYEKERRALESEKLQSIKARTNTNVLKVAMLYSASQGDDRILKINHWEKSLERVLAIQDQTVAVFREARGNSSGPKDQSAITHAVLSVASRHAGITVSGIRSRLSLTHGSLQVDQAIRALVGAGMLRVNGAAGKTEVLAEANNYL